MANDTAPGRVVPVMRVGHATRGATHILIGVPVVLAAWTGGKTEGTQGGDLSGLRGSPRRLAARGGHGDFRSLADRAKAKAAGVSAQIG